MAVDIVKLIPTTYDARPVSMHGDEDMVIWFGEHCARHPNPEWRLWAACLQSAFHDLEKVSGRIKFRNQLRWFLDDREGVGTFIFVCEVLGIDPAYFRRNVLSHFGIDDENSI